MMPNDILLSSDWCLVQLSSERLPLTAHGTWCKDPHPHYKERINCRSPLGSLRIEDPCGRWREKILGGDGGRQENMTNWIS